MYEVADQTSSVTADQREALVTAYEHGYFEDPRETTQAELADVLGIPSTAVSSLLRRGMECLVEQSLVECPPDGRAVINGFSVEQPR
jgi:predicted DNA binding protein